MDLFHSSNKFKKEENMNFLFKSGSRTNTHHSKDQEQGYYGSVVGADATPTEAGITVDDDKPIVRDDMTEEDHSSTAGSFASFSTEEESSLRQRACRAGRVTAFLSTIAALGLVYSLGAGLNTSSTRSRDTSLYSLLGEGGSSTNNNRSYVASSSSSTATTKSTGRVFTAHARGFNGNKLCLRDSDCGGSFCLTEDRPNYPYPNRCYPCLNTQDCPSGKRCEITIDNAHCASVDVAEPPSLYYLEKGYDIFSGDPMFTEGDGLHDPGHATEQFYNHVWHDDSNHKISIGDKEYYTPEGFSIKGNNVKQERAQTEVITDTTTYVESIERSIEFDAKGNKLGVSLGGSVGVTTYKETRDLVSASITFAQSQIYAALYTFNMSSRIKLSLTDGATKTLNELTSNDDDWNAFFHNYGTHIITKGIFGAFSRATYSFTETQRNSLETTERTFQQSLDIGIPEIMTFSATSGGEDAQKIGEKINRMNTEVQATDMGDINDLTNSPGLIHRTLVPICEYIDYDVFKNINSSDHCYKHLKKYCLQTLAESGLDNDVCEYPSDSNFECVVDKDCPSPSFVTKWTPRCDKGRCKQCLNDSHCGTGRNMECNGAGECVRKPSYEVAGCETYRDFKERGSNCVWWPGCPNGYPELDRYDNSPCWVGTQRKICRKYLTDWYLTPPCSKLLKGTCGDGNRGNGCCNGEKEQCTERGWCLPYDDNSFMYPVVPSAAQCQLMVGFTP